MRRPVDAAPPARHALLGLLLEGPCHGYDLIRAFAPATPLGSTIHLGASHVYSLLARLERDGLVAGEEQQQETHPPRRIFRITEAGTEAIQRWLDAPVTRPREVLLDFPLKLYLAQRLDPARAAVLVARQRALFATLLSEMEAEEPPITSDADGVFLSLLHESRVIRTRATLEWLDRCAARMGESAGRDRGAERQARETAEQAYAAAQAEIARLRALVDPPSGHPDPKG